METIIALILGAIGLVAGVFISTKWRGATNGDGDSSLGGSSRETGDSGSARDGRAELGKAQSALREGEERLDEYRDRAEGRDREREGIIKESRELFRGGSQGEGSQGDSG